MANDKGDGMRSRRALLGAGLGAVAATAAGALTRPAAVRASDGDYVRVGGEYTGSSVTKITNSFTTALQGVSAWAVGVSGSSSMGTGVFGSSGSGYGVYGGSGVIGIYGSSTSTVFPASVGASTGNSTGLLGYSGSVGGSVPAGKPKTGVYGVADQDAAAVGVRGTSALGRGGQFAGKKAQIRLYPSTDASHPASGAKGDLFVDASGRLWFCKGGTTWKQLA